MTDTTQDTTTESKPTGYQLIGGEAGVRRLVKRFYELMDIRPEAQGIRAMHPPSLAGSEEKLFMYLTGYLGGPDLFVAKYGHPRLRARHLPFSIGASERDQWLDCMRQAIDETIELPALRTALLKPITDLADWMRNKPEVDTE